MRSTHRFIGVALLMVVGLLAVAALAVSATGGRNVENGRAVCRTTEQNSVSLAANYFLWAPLGPFVDAIQHNYYGQEGLKMKIVPSSTPLDAVKLVATGRATFGRGNVEAVLQGRDRNIPVVSVGLLVNHIDEGFISLPGSGITTPASLKGKTLGVVASPDQQGYLSTMLADAHLTSKDVKVVDPGFSGVNLLLAGKLDAYDGIVNYELLQVNDRLEEGKGKATFLGFNKFGVPNLPFDILYTTEDYAKKNPNTICHFMYATKRGWQDFLKHPAPVLAYLHSKNPDLTPSEHAGALKGIGSWVAHPGAPYGFQDAATWAKAAAWAQKVGIIKKALPTSDYFTNQYIPK